MAPRALPLLMVVFVGSCFPSPATPDQGEEPKRVPLARLPPGSELAYGGLSHGAMDVFVMAADQTRPSLLVGGWADESHPAWSPDGRRLAFVSNSEGRPILRVLDSVTGATADLVTHPPRPDSPVPDATGPLSWSSQDGLLAFSSSLARDADVWLATTDGTGRAGLLIQGAGTQEAPAWSPDGHWLAYACQGPLGPSDLDICVATDKGADVRRVTSGPARDSDATWSPDGRRIAYSSRPACADALGCGLARIFAIDIEGGNAEDLSRAAEDDFAPAWSPDGSLIAFTRNNEVWLMNADGSNQALLLAGQWPAWRP